MGKFLEGLGEELSLYVRQVAWLQAAPKDDDKRSLAAGSAPSEAKSRLSEFLDAGLVPALPDNPSPWLTDTLMEIGPSEAAGMDDGVISWRTLHSWQDQMGLRLPPWQLRMLRLLSRAYIAESQRAKKKGCPAPWSSETRDIRRALVADKVDRILDAIAAGPPPKRRRTKK